MIVFMLELPLTRRRAGVCLFQCAFSERSSKLVILRNIAVAQVRIVVSLWMLFCDCLMTVYRSDPVHLCNTVCHRADGQDVSEKSISGLIFRYPSPKQRFRDGIQRYSCKYCKCAESSGLYRFVIGIQHLN